METQSHIHTQRHAHIHRCIHLHIHGHISCCHVHTCTHTRAHVISHPWIWVSAISSASVILHVLFWFHFIHPLSFIESVCSARATIWLHKALQKMLLFLLFPHCITKFCLWLAQVLETLNAVRARAKLYLLIFVSPTLSTMSGTL